MKRPPRPESRSARLEGRTGTNAAAAAAKERVMRDASRPSSSDPKSLRHPRKRSLAIAAGVVLIAGAAGTFAVAQNAVSMTREIGEACNDYVEGDACASGIAIDISFGFVCSDHCTEDQDCPTDWGCKAVSQGNGEDAHLCFPRRVTVSEGSDEEGGA